MGAPVLRSVLGLREYSPSSESRILIPSASNLFLQSIISISVLEPSILALSKILLVASFYHSVKCDCHIWIWQCFQIYGKLSMKSLRSNFLQSNEYRANKLKGSKVRVSPGSVLLHTPKAYGDVFNDKANVKKGTTYDTWARHKGDANTGTVTDIAIHARKRKIFNTVFKDMSVRSAAAFIIKHPNRWNELSATGYRLSEPIDCTKRTDCLVFDILGDSYLWKVFRHQRTRRKPLQDCNGDNSLIHEVLASGIAIFCAEIKISDIA